MGESRVDLKGWHAQFGKQSCKQEARSAISNTQNMLVQQVPATVGRDAAAAAVTAGRPCFPHDASATKLAA